MTCPDDCFYRAAAICINNEREVPCSRMSRYQYLYSTLAVYQVLVVMYGLYVLISHLRKIGRQFGVRLNGLILACACQMFHAVYLILEGSALVFRTDTFEQMRTLKIIINVCIAFTNTGTLALMLQVMGFWSALGNATKMLTSARAGKFSGLSYKITVPAVLVSLLLEMIYRMLVAAKNMQPMALFAVYSLYIVVMILGVGIPMIYFAHKLRQGYKENLELTKRSGITTMSNTNTRTMITTPEVNPTRTFLAPPPLHSQQPIVVNPEGTHTIGKAVKLDPNVAVSDGTKAMISMPRPAMTAGGDGPHGAAGGAGAMGMNSRANRRREYTNLVSGLVMVSSFLGVLIIVASILQAIYYQFVGFSTTVHCTYICISDFSKSIIQIVCIYMYRPLGSVKTSRPSRDESGGPPAGFDPSSRRRSSVMNGHLFPVFDDNTTEVSMASGGGDRDRIKGSPNPTPRDDDNDSKITRLRRKSFDSQDEENHVAVSIPPRNALLQQNSSGNNKNNNKNSRSSSASRSRSGSRSGSPRASRSSSESPRNHVSRPPPIGRISTTGGFVGRASVSRTTPSAVDQDLPSRIAQPPTLELDPAVAVQIRDGDEDSRRSSPPHSRDSTPRGLHHGGGYGSEADAAGSRESSRRGSVYGSEAEVVPVHDEHSARSASPRSEEAEAEAEASASENRSEPASERSF